MKYIAIYNMILFFSIGVYIGYTLKGDRIVEKEVVKYETQWIKPPIDLTFEESLACVKSYINITHKLDNNWIHIYASDMCKKARKDVRLEYHNQWKEPIIWGLAGALLATGTYLILKDRQFNLTYKINYQ